MSPFSFSTTGEEVVKAFPDKVKGRTFVITGASTQSLGSAAALSLAHGGPSAIILLARSAAKVEPVLEQIRATDPSISASFVPMDLCSLDSVRAAARKIQEGAPKGKIDVLINSAGVMAVKDFQKTEYEVEMHFGANHVGHFLLAGLLVEGGALGKKEGDRVVNVSSDGYGATGVRYEDWNFQDGKDYNPWYGYGQSKTANILHAQSLSDWLGKSGAQAFSVHPGLVLASRLQDDVAPELFQSGLDMAKDMNGGVMPEFEKPKSLEQGASTILVAALDPSLEGSSGSHLKDCQITPVMDHAKGDDNKQKLWDLSEKLVGQKFEIK